MKIKTLLITTLCLVFNLAGRAQTTDSTAAVTKTPAPPPEVPQSLVTVKFSQSEGHKINFLSNEKILADYFIKVKINGPAYDFANSHPDSMRLWMDNICFKDIQPDFLSSDSTLIYKLQWDTAKTSPWQMYYGYPQYITRMTHAVEINAGTLKKEFRKPVPHKNILVTSDIYIVILAYLLFFGILYLVLRIRKGLLRDAALFANMGIEVSYDKTVQTNAQLKILNIKDVPFSLAKSQFLFWLAIIYISILHIWAFTDTLVSPTGTVLVLLGISGGTFYLGKAIDNTGGKTDPAEDAKISQVISDLLEKNKRSHNNRFMFDILSDGQDVSLHRLQLLMFTVFLGVYFSWYVIFNLQMPQFSETMMLLMGISSTTYAGMKTMEK